MSSSTCQLSSAASTAAASQKYSCVQCQQRKVKCDKLLPACSVCATRGTDCVYRLPPPPRRGKRKVLPENLLARLRVYEELLRKHGVNVEDLELDQTSTQEKTSKELLEEPKLLIDNGNSTATENNLWTGMSYELHGDGEPSTDNDNAAAPATAYAYSQDGDFALGLVSSARTDLTAFHPPPALMFALWQVFLSNVDPMIKVLHTPTVQDLVLKAGTDLNSISKPVECLMFAIYASAVNSMDDAACFITMNESKASLSARYQLRCRQSLSNAEFLGSSDIRILQAYVLFLASISIIWDASRLWVLVGIAIRLAQRMGLHRDGTTLGLPVFEIEMRRRLWYQIVWLEIRAAELSGMRASGDSYEWDTKVPLNVYDSDLFPHMVQFPPSRPEPTEMVFSLVRAELLEYLRTWRHGQTSAEAALSTIAAKDLAVDGMERILTERVRLCNANVPVQCAAYHRAHIGHIKARLIGHNTRQYTDKNLALPQPERESIFHMALKVITHHNQAEDISQFSWYTKNHFQWNVFGILLEELCRRHLEAEFLITALTDQAWEEVGKAFANHPEIIQKRDNPMYVEIGKLALRAWDTRTSGLHQETPHFISLLRSQNSTFGTTHSSSTVPGADVSMEQLPASLRSSEYIGPMDWQYWDGIFQSGYQYEPASQGPFEKLYKF